MSVWEGAQNSNGERSWKELQEMLIIQLVHTNFPLPLKTKLILKTVVKVALQESNSLLSQ